jgi:hypothetical protein
MKLMMKLLGWALLASLFLSACSPASTPLAPIVLSEATATAPSQPDAPVTSRETTPTEASQPAAAATSRGDKLEASDPASVHSGAGRPVLIEFFRFT